jgi:hypothetical protein
MLGETEIGRSIADPNLRIRYVGSLALVETSGAWLLGGSDFDFAACGSASALGAEPSNAKYM